MARYRGPKSKLPGNLVNPFLGRIKCLKRKTILPVFMAWLPVVVKNRNTGYS